MRGDALNRGVCRQAGVSVEIVRRSFSTRTLVASWIE